MSRNRTAPLSQPLGWEKSTSRCEIGCTESERLLWQSAFGKGGLSDAVRELVNREVYRRAGIPVEGVPDTNGILPKALCTELRRHVQKLKALARFKSKHSPG